MKQHRLRWMENWTICIRWLDDRHRDLMDYYQGVIDALCNNAEDGAFVERLNHVREWLGQLFLNEESVLQNIGYEDIHPNRQDHQQFVSALDDFASNSQNVYGYHDRTAASMYIFYWLIRHGNATTPK